VPVGFAMLVVVSLSTPAPSRAALAMVDEVRLP
jgi:hypothetical protein